MTSSAAVAILLHVAVSSASAQCGTPQVDSTRCARWMASSQNFCTNAFYSLAARQQYCGNACGLCTATTVAATTINAVCATITTATPTNVPNPSPTAVAIAGAGAGAINAATGITVRASCSLVLLDATPAPIGAPVTSANQGALSAAQQAAVSATCSCTA